MLSNRTLLCFGCILLLAGCGTQTIRPSDKHLAGSDAGAGQGKGVPPTVNNNILPPPKPAAKVETYSVVVTNVSAQEVLFALARDAKINLDVYPGLQGYVTLNAVNQTLPQILDRIGKQIDIRYEWNGPNLSVMPDTPFLKQYKIDYVNVDRDALGGVNSTSQISSGLSGAGAGGAAGSNGSQLSIKNASKNHFWDTLVQNIRDILRETDKEIVVSRRTSDEQATPATKTSTPSTTPPATAQQTSADKAFKDYQTLFAATVISNPEAGIITVRASGKQQAKIQQFIDQVMVNARRQVMIEATIVEVTLSDSYQQGIDWSKFLAAGVTKGFNISQTGAATTGVGTLLVNYVNPTSKFGNISASVSLLETFGKTKVLSSPKISVLNNQTAMLRVVDNNVWFNVNSTTTPCSPAPCVSLVTYTTTVNTVQVGFTMSVTPQINENNSVLLNIRPSITRRLADATDPTPNLFVVNKVPQLSTREMESVLKIENNQIAILGGLMEDSTNKQSQEVPLLGEIPILGELFKSRSDSTSKTELVIFLRPVVIKEASVNGDYNEFRSSLPTEHFFDPNNSPATLPKP